MSKTKEETKSVVMWERPAQSPKELHTALAQYGGMFKNNAPAEMNVSNLIGRVARLADLDNKIMLCTQSSIRSATLFCAQIGMMPNTPEGHVYLIPYHETKTNTYKLQAIMGYKGLLTLAHRCAAVRDTFAATVYKDEQFTYEAGSNPRIVHNPEIDSKHVDEDIRCFYAVINLKNGGQQMKVIPRSEVQCYYDKAKYGSAWKDSFGPMGEKTAVRRAMKLVPFESSTFNNRAMNLAIQMDEAAEAGKGADEVIDGEFIDLDNQDDRILNSVKNAVSDTPPPAADEKTLVIRDIQKHIGTDRLKDVLAAQGFKAPPILSELDIETLQSLKAELQKEA